MPSRKKDECVISIDAGTQSIRACLIDFRGNIIQIVKNEIDPYFSVNPGWAEQDPEYFWNVLARTCKKLMSSLVVKKDSIRGVTLTTQRNTMINLDCAGKPLRPAFIWLDRRKAKPEKWPPLYLRLPMQAAGLYDIALYGIMESEANWIYQNQREIWDGLKNSFFCQVISPGGFVKIMLIQRVTRLVMYHSISKNRSGHRTVILNGKFFI